MIRVLVADEDPAFRRSVAEALRLAHFDVVESSTIAEAAAELEKTSFDLLLIEPGQTGEEAIEALRPLVARLNHLSVVVVTAHGSRVGALEALRFGTQGYLVKPIPPELVLQKIRELLHRRPAAESRPTERGPAASEGGRTGLVGTSPAMRDLEQTILKVAPTEATVLIAGETGTGKDLVARAIHHHSPRREQPFVTINCSAIPEQLLESQLFGHVRGAFTGASRDHAGLFETAGRGTIFLDEIGEMPLALQPKVLRAVEARELTPLGSTSPVPITARIVAATHRDLRTMTESGQFRKDLYYRLSTIEISIPPLRTRPEDVEPLAQHLLVRFAGNARRSAPSLTPAARALLEQYEWPGNVRELANLIERALILNLGSSIDAKDFPKILTPVSMPPSGDLRMARDAFERLFIRRVIGLCAGDKLKAAKVLGIGIASLYRKLGSGASATPKPTNGRPRRSSNS